MKIILSILLLSTSVICELPSPYYQPSARPSSQFLNLQKPKTQYGPPKLQSNILDVQLPSKLTIEQLIRLTEQLQSSQGRIVNTPQTIQLSTPQSSYLPPPRQPQRVYGSPGKVEWSQSQHRPPPPKNFGISQPQSLYNRPPQVLQQTQRPQNQYGPPPQTLKTGDTSQNYPQNTYAVPSFPQLPKPSEPSNFGVFNPQTPPSTNYGVPDIRTVETFEEFRNKPQNDQDRLRQNLLRDLGKQHLPYRAPTGFRPQGSQITEAQNVARVNQQYVPANADASQSGVNQSFPPEASQSQPQNLQIQQYLPPSGGNVGQNPQNSLVSQSGNIPSNVPQTSGGNNIGSGGDLNNAVQNYLPPQTTPKPILATRPTTIKPRTVETTPVATEATTNYDYDYDLQQPTESPTNPDGSASDPNVSISNAVAGGGGFFYLQQPDGRLQRVVLQKTQEPSSKPEEYVANYYFQNIHALPTVTYAPLVSLRAWK